jgi:hypothetical protein
MLWLCGSSFVYGFYSSFYVGQSFNKVALAGRIKTQYEKKLARYDAFTKLLETNYRLLDDKINEVKNGKVTIVYDVDMISSVYTAIKGIPPEESLKGCFGIPGNAESLAQCEKKISDRFHLFYDVAAEVFKKEDGFLLSPFKKAHISRASEFPREIYFYLVEMTNEKYPRYKTKLFCGSGPKCDGTAPHTIRYQYFYDEPSLQDYLDLNYLQSSSTLDDWHKAYKRPVLEGDDNIRATSKKGLTLCLVVGIDKTFVPKGKKFGLYMGTEFCADIDTGKKVLKDWCAIRSKGLGFNILFGLGSKNSWSIYGVYGLRHAFNSVHLLPQLQKINKNKMEQEIGIAASHQLTNRITLNIRYIRTLPYQLKLRKNTEIRISSSRIIFGFSYYF